MSYSSRAFEDSCEFLGLELGSETALDLCQEYNKNNGPIPAWLEATWRVRLCTYGGHRDTEFREQWERGEHPVDPADVETASRAFCVWPKYPEQLYAERCRKLKSLPAADLLRLSRYGRALMRARTTAMCLFCSAYDALTEVADKADDCSAIVERCCEAAIGAAISTCEADGVKQPRCWSDVWDTFTYNYCVYIFWLPGGMFLHPDGSITHGYADNRKGE